MVEYNQSEKLKRLLENDINLSFSVPEDLIHIGMALGNNLQIIKDIYYAYQDEKEYYVYHPMVGAKMEVSFNYEAGTVTFKRNQATIPLSIEEFLIFLGKIDAMYSEILPIGSIIELEVERMSNEAQEIFSKGEAYRKLMVTGRKIPLIDEFKPYMVDYFCRFWPFGEIPNHPPIFISNMMIKRVISYGFSNEEEEKIAVDVLKNNQLGNFQISTAFMSSTEVNRYYEFLNEKGNEDGHSD